ncbi:MAG: hypothetical protein WCD79_12390 [Chthoniobacteraceae bacterium]
MRSLTKNESKLLAIFLGAIFLILNLMGLAFLFRTQGELRSRLVNLKNVQLESKSWLAENNLWTQRKNWMDEKQPKLQNTGEANAALLETLQTGARKQNITIVEQGFGEPNFQPSYQEISVKLKINGSLEAITRWLVELQQPANFQAVPTLSMKSDSDPAKIICELTVARWYAAK